MSDGFEGNLSELRSSDPQAWAYVDHLRHNDPSTASAVAARAALDVMLTTRTVTAELKATQSADRHSARLTWATVALVIATAGLLVVDLTH